MQLLVCKKNICCNKVRASERAPQTGKRRGDRNWSREGKRKEEIERRERRKRRKEKNGTRQKVTSNIHMGELVERA